MEKQAHIRSYESSFNRNECPKIITFGWSIDRNSSNKSDAIKYTGKKRSSGNSVSKCSVISSFNGSVWMYIFCSHPRATMRQLIMQILVDHGFCGENKEIMNKQKKEKIEKRKIMREIKKLSTLVSVGRHSLLLINHILSIYKKGPSIYCYLSKRP